MKSKLKTPVKKTLLERRVSATALGAAEAESLNRQGYLILTNLIDRSSLEKLCAGFEVAAARQRTSTEGKESGTRHPADLLKQTRVFDEVITQPKIMTAINHVLGRPFGLSQFSGRDPLPGFGQQGLHADWMNRTSSDLSWVVTVIWMLDEFTNRNGATRVVPGSHRMPGQPPKAMGDPAAHHREELIVTGPAGSALVFNGHLWHSGTRNDSQSPRRALQAVYWAREAFPPFATPLHDRPEELSPALRSALRL
jgi:ectoine hydroxylase-related dioxygenase (phytanoyl-CoA dioxygenase family)